MTKEVAKKEENLPATIDFGADAGAGFEEATKDCFAIPFLRQAQALSPQLNKKKSEYIPGLEVGDFYNSVTNKTYKGEDGVVVIPCHFRQVINEWELGRGGFKGAHSPEEYARLPKKMGTDQKGNTIELNAETGHQLVDTREHYVLIVSPDGALEPALLALSSSQLKRSKKWMTMMQNIRINGKPAPMFSHKYKLSACEESNESGDWAGVKPELVGMITSVEEYTQAKNFRQMIISGSAKAQEGDDNVPF